MAHGVYVLKSDPIVNPILRNFYGTTEFYNGRTAKRQWKNGNGMVETGHNSGLCTLHRSDGQIAGCQVVHVQRTEHEREMDVEWGGE